MPAQNTTTLLDKMMIEQESTSPKFGHRSVYLFIYPNICFDRKQAVQCQGCANRVIP